VLQRLLETEESLERRARSLAERLRALAPELDPTPQPDRSYAGGGALPDFSLPTFAVALRPPGGAAQLAERLRQAQPPVLGRIRDDALLLDLRSLDPAEEDLLEQALRGMPR
jgi:L-seryl-tRNA(Ser) seleniumtransferase